MRERAHQLVILQAVVRHSIGKSNHIPFDKVCTTTSCCKMPVIELTMLGVALFGVLATGIMAVNTSTFLPDRIGYMKEVALHAYRKRKYRYRLRISVSSSPLPFAAFASYLSEGCKMFKAKQFVSMTLNNHTFHFNIPETHSDIYIPRTRCLIHLGGPSNGACEYIMVYYKTNNDYTFIQTNILQPFVQGFTKQS